MGFLALLASFRLIAAGWIEDPMLQRDVESRVKTEPKTFVLDLDTPPKDRWAALGEDPDFANYSQDYKNYLGQYIPKAVLPLVTTIVSGLKGHYYDDYADEMVGLAKALKMSVGDVVLANLIYQLEHIGRTCEAGNTTGPCPNKTGPGLCTAAIVNGPDDGDEVWQGRNLDWDLDDKLLRYVLRVEYQRGGKTLFTGVQIAGEIGILHGLMPGVIGVQMNARKEGGNLLDNLAQIILGHKTPTHVLRRALEESASYESAMDFLATTKLANPVYYVVSGARHGQGAIITRDRKGARDVWNLYEPSSKDTKGINPQPDWFRLQTNFDHWEPVPSEDDRRHPGVANIKAFCNSTASQACVNKVMTTWPTKNHHTDVTSIMCPKTGYLDVAVWLHPEITLV